MTMQGPSRTDYWAFFRNVAATITALGIITGAIWYWVQPRVIDFLRTELSLPSNLTVDIAKIQDVQTRQAETQQQQAQTLTVQQQSLSEISRATATLTSTLESTVNRVAMLEESSRRDKTPPVMFVEDGNSIDSGAIGAFVRIQFRYIKSRDCGRPNIAVYFTDGAGISHAFREVSTVADDGRGGSAPVRPEVQTTRFIAKIPESAGVTPTTGTTFALGFMLMSWPGCPDVPEVRSPRVPFQITD
ncbi:hypothetical protein [Falsirhodobacter halotolerans]|uniref:hypothetical protein n=1 Tax=Falsirhodobacter halotolerans TaxID=1146892 RepID=UPI001FD565D2|nr:hypothetical protein [Falsirhodobacter halotolerans]MCJ8138448.1 hypothetical protein [Falsirhodobacter halotolerans]